MLQAAGKTDFLVDDMNTRQFKLESHSYESGIHY